jgi:cytochrome b6-f complex iron-sulfur subunit
MVMSELPEKLIRRRDFLGLAAISTFAIATAAACFGALRLVVPKVFSEPPNNYKIGEPEGLPLGEVKVPTGKNVYVFHDEHGYYAISAKCTHLGCIITHTPEGFVCPCHGSRFTLDGHVISGSASKTLDWFAMSLAPDGQLVVDEGEKVKAGTFFVV